MHRSVLAQGRHSAEQVQRVHQKQGPSNKRPAEARQSVRTCSA